MKNTHLVTDGCASRTARSTFAGALLLKTVLLLAVALVSLPFNSWSVLLSYLPRERGGVLEQEVLRHQRPAGLHKQRGGHEPCWD